MKNKIEAAINLLKANGYMVSEPPQELQETQYQKAIRTGIKPAIWPPISMTGDDLQHFRATHGIG